MRTTKRVLQAAGITAGAIGAIAASAPGNPIGRGARRLGEVVFTPADALADLGRIALVTRY